MEVPARDPEIAPSKDVAELHLLISEMGDELSAYRWREAVWISIVVHVLIFLGLIFVPKWLPKSAVIIALNDQNNNLNFLTAPNDRQQVKTPPKTDIMSDKNRVAQSPKPVLDKKLLRKLLDMQRPGPPAAAAAPKSPAQQAMQQAPQQATPDQQNGSQNPAQAPPQPPQQAQLQTPQQRPRGPVDFHTGGPGIEQAIQNSASRGATHYSFGGGDYGPTRLQPNTNMRGDVEILSDTMGVDFGPYLQRVLYRIKMNWYNLIPEVARPPIMKRGNLILHFSILKNGQVSGLKYEYSSGDIALDRAAYGGITNSDPFDRLPPEFNGTYLELRIKFIYNSTTDDVN